MNEDRRIPISVSVRHVHLTREHVEHLFGPGYQLTAAAELSQPGQFACEETLDLKGPKGSLEKVRVIGPERGATQVEISRTDEFTLGVDAPIRPSGKVKGSPGIEISGPKGTLALPEGVIQAQRHIHMQPEDAQRFGVQDRDWVLVRVGGERGILFDDVLVRVSEKYRLDMHLDTDEANAADIKPGATGELCKDATTVRPNPDD